jgi:CHAT domain-containing protein
LGDAGGDLPGARQEAIQVARWLGTEAVLGANVVRSRLNDALHGCDLLHVGCHAHFYHSEPERSGFVLADGGLFSARDARKLRLRAHLAVLSASESGRLNVQSGDELTGVASSLLAAGIQSIVATSWRIPDSATALLIEAFYAGLLDGQATIAAALRSAQQHVARHRPYSLPYYWAAFRVFGDWRTRFTGGRRDGEKSEG